MTSNKTATVVLLDIGSLVSEIFDNSETFFKKSQWCLLRIIQRLIFSDENDELAVVIFGSEKTKNSINITEAGMYSNIVEFCDLQKANWDLYEKVQKLTTTDVMNSNWIEGLKIALNYLKQQTLGKRFKNKQIIVMSNFAMEVDSSKSLISLIADCMNLDDIKLVTIGVNLEDECKYKEVSSQLPVNLGLLYNLIDKVENGISLSFAEAEDDLVYFRKKSKTGRFTKVNLIIGSKIDIPVRWIKLNLEPTRIKWVRKSSRKLIEMPRFDSRMNLEHDMKEIEPQIGFNNEGINYANFELLKRKTGPASCIILGFVKSYRIRREMFIGENLYLIVPERATRAQAMLSALIDALIANDKYALVRRVATYNGRIKLGVLIPELQETDNGLCKQLYFIQLPFAEYALNVPEVKMPEPNDQELLKEFDNLIDAMMITDKPKDFLMKDPSFQYECHILQQYQTGMMTSNSKDPPVPDFIQKLVDPYPELQENALPVIEKLVKLLPIQIEKFLDPQSKENNELILLKMKENTKSKVALNQPRTSNNNEDTEAQKLPDQQNESCDNKSFNAEVSVPTLNTKDTNFISDRQLEDQIIKHKISADIQQMSDKNRVTQEECDPEENCDTDEEFDTQELLERVKRKFALLP